MSPWMGVLLFVVSPLLGGALWLFARVEYPGTPVRTGLFAIAWLIGLELLQLVAEPFVRLAFSGTFRAEFLPVAAFNWLVLVLPIVLIDFYAIRLARRVATTGLEIEEPSVLEASRHDADRRQLSALALGKVVAMAATLGSALALLAVAVSAVLPYLVVYFRGRHSELLWWMALTIRNRLHPAEELLAFAESQKRGMRRRLVEAARSVQRGTDVVDALIMHRLLSPGEIVELRVARATGALERGFVACARRCSSERATMAVSTNGTIVWLWFMVTGIVLVLFFISYSILPKYKAIFADFGAELPRMTQRLARFSDDGIELVALLLSLCVLTGWLVLGSILLTVGWQELQWPWLQQFFPRRDAANVLRLLGYPIRAGWPVPQSVHLLADEVLRDDLRERLNRVGEQIDAGLDLGGALRQEGFLRSAEAEAVNLGIRGGPARLDFALQTLADSLERIRAFRFHRFVEFLKPLLLIGLASIVAVTVLAMFEPIARLIGRLS